MLPLYTRLWTRRHATPDPPRSEGEGITDSAFVNHVCSARVRERDFARSGGDDAARETRRMARAEHGRKGLLARRPVGLDGGERADLPAFGIAQRRVPGAGVGRLARLRPVLVGDSGRAERLPDPASA